MRTATQLIILGLATSATSANAGSPTLLADDLGNRIITSLDHRIKTSLETQNLKTSTGRYVVTRDGDRVIATTHN